MATDVQDTTQEGTIVDGKALRPTSPNTETIEPPQEVDPNNEVGIVTDEGERDNFQKNQQRLNEIEEERRQAQERVAQQFSGETPEGLTAEQQRAFQGVQSAFGGEKPKEEQQPLTLVNAETGQEVNFQDPQINKRNVQNFLDRGFEVIEGNLPTGISVGDETEADQLANQVTEANEQIDTEFGEQIDMLNSFQAEVDEALASEIENIKQRYAQRREKAKRQNESRVEQFERTNIRLGTQRFAPQIAGGILAEEERAGMRRIDEINSNMNSEIAAAREAARQNDWKILSEKMTLIEERREERQEQIKELNKKAIEQAEELVEREREVNRDIAISRAVDSGIDTVPKVLKILNRAGITATAEEVSDTLKSFGQDEKLTGTAQDFRSFVKTGLIDSNLPVEKQWSQFIDLTSEDEELSINEIAKLRDMGVNVPLGTTHSDLVGLNLPKGEPSGSGTGDQGASLSSTEIRQLRERVDNNDRLLDLATEYRNIVEEKGFTNRIFGDKETLGKIQGIRGQMTAVYKDAKTLGALDEGVLRLMEQVIGIEPTSGLFTPLRNITGGKQDQVIANIDTLIDSTSQDLMRDRNRLESAGASIEEENIEATQADVSDIDSAQTGDVIEVAGKKYRKLEDGNFEEI